MHQIQIARLHRLHTEADEALRRERSRVAPDAFAVARLKKEKLKLKDWITSLAQQTENRIA